MDKSFEEKIGRTAQEVPGKESPESVERTGEPENELEGTENIPTPRKETPLEFLGRAEGEDLAERGPETLRLIDSLEKDEKTAALADTGQKIAGALARSAQKIKERREVIANAREGLGIPPSEEPEDPPSLASELERHKKLFSLLEEVEARAASMQKMEGVAEDEKEEENKAEHMRILRESLEPVSEQINRLNSILRKRGGEQLYPLMDEQGTAQLSAASRALTELTSSRTPNSGEVAEEISRIAIALREYGNVRGVRTLREDGESLRQVGFAIRGLADSVHAAQTRIAGKGRDTPEYHAIDRLSQALDTAVSSHFRKVAAFQRYTGR